MEKLLNSLDSGKGKALENIDKVACQLPSLTAQRGAPRTNPLRSMQSAQEPRGRVEGTRQSPFVDDAELVECIDSMGYRINMVLFQVLVCGSLVDVSLVHIGHCSSNMWR